MKTFKVKVIIVFLFTFITMLFTGSQLYAAPVQEQSTLVLSKLALMQTITDQYENWRRKDLVLTQADYTSDSWSAYVGAISTGKNVEKSFRATKAEVDAAKDAIIDTKASLVFAGKANLDLAVASAPSSEQQADYTESSWSVLVDALALPETTNAEVVAKTDAVNNAVSRLITKAAADALAKIIGEARGLVEADYTESSWNVLKDAVALPGGTNNLLLEKVAAIRSAIDLLITKAAVNDLANIIAEARGLVEADYTESSWNALKDAVALPGETNDLLLEKIAAIRSAIDKLVTKSAADALAKIIGEARGLVEANYSVTSWNALKDAVALPGGTNDLVLEKVAAIRNAIDSLVYAGKENLDKAKLAANLIQMDYTQGSWALLTVALALPESTNAEMLSKTVAINNSVNALVFAGKANLDKAKANAATKVASKYTVESYKVLTNALALKETTNTLVVAKTLAINNAIAGLKSSSLTYRVTAYIGLNCRIAPDISSYRVKAYPYGTVLQITQVKNGWGKTKDGWVYMNYVASTSKTVVKYSVMPTIGLNCRIAPDINSKKVTAFKYQTILDISEILNGWGKTQRGWVCMQYLRSL